MRFTSSAYDDNNAAIDSVPATDSIYVGTGFMPQTTNGLQNNTNPIDDRVSFMAGSPDVGNQNFGSSVPADVNNIGAQSVYGNTGSVFSGVTYGDYDPVGYDTLRPNGGFPLPIVPDNDYGNATNDIVSTIVNDDFDSGIGWTNAHMVSEKPQQTPQRNSTYPATLQVPRPWDIIMGAWPFTGIKAALQRPVAATPFTFKSPLANAIPSPTGTSNADHWSTDLETHPMTFRAPVEPWDTGTDGNYVDSGA